MRSLRRRLFVLLLAAIGMIWLAAIGWIYIRTSSQIEHVLDARLQEAARMVDSLVAGSDVSQGRAAPLQIHPELVSYQHQLACQVWSLDGRLIAEAGAPQANLSVGSSGFSDTIIDGEAWRIYAVEDSAKGLRIMVGDRLGLRGRLVGDLVTGLIVPALLIMPILGGLIWASVGRGLRPLAVLTKELESRDADDMSPIEVRDSPQEVRPLADALNGLFAKVETTRRLEREVTAFAAHELCTPLAGLKAQAQVAIAAGDPSVKEGALRQILVAVDRTTRLVRQLLALAKLDANADHLWREQIVNLGQMLEEIAETPRSSWEGAGVDLDPALNHLEVRSNRELLALALRNLHENAVLYTPHNGIVRWAVADNGMGIFVEDEGPGIPQEELPLVTRRFFRGRHKSASGSGLGLAIVELALKRIGASLRLHNKTESSGLRAEVALPRNIVVRG